MNRTLIARLALSPLLALSLAACNEGRVSPDPAGSSASAKLSRFADCDDMRLYLTRAWTETLVESRYSYYRWDMPMAEGDLEAGGDDGSGGDEGPDSYSETNTQEQGVDEPDIVKTDGEHIYVLHDAQLSVLDSWPAEETHSLATLDLPGWPTNMFLQGDQLLVFSYDWDERGWETDGGGYNERTLMTVVDISDRSDPTITREIAVEGWLNGARMVDGHVYAVTNAWTWMPESLWNLAWDENSGLPEVDYDSSDAEIEMARIQARAMLTPHVAAVVSTLSDADLLPLASDGLPGEDADPQPLMGCDEIYRPAVLADPNMTSVVHLDLGEVDGELSGTGLMAAGWNLYASTDHLVIAQTSWDWWWGGDDTALETHLHRFALEGDGATYEGSGSVGGWLLNQFSMSEYDGHLRVATTDMNAWGWGWDGEDRAEPANNVFVLEQTATGFTEVGHVGGIAPGETIQAVRFLGEKGFVVTYEQIDPLFTLDLSVPSDPRIIGELELPGFSTYLHPVNEDLLLSVGFAGTWEGQITGMAISLFDVSDFANPRLADQILLESDDWSWSEALYDHHAFTYFNGVLSLPIYTWQWDEDTRQESYFSGMLVVDVDPEGGSLTEIGRVDHADMVEDSVCRWYGEGATEPCNDDYWYASMRRSVVVEDSLFSISDYGVKVTPQRQPEDLLARVLFYPLAD